jgi:hypothetical protein
MTVGRTLEHSLTFLVETSLYGVMLTETAFLDHSAAHMAALVGCSGHCETGDRGRMASGGLSPVLALAI